MIGGGDPFYLKFWVILVDAPAYPLVGWEGDTPSPILTAFGASILAPSALSCCGPQFKILATPLHVAQSLCDS